MEEKAGEAGSKVELKIKKKHKINCKKVELKRDSAGLGLSIVGGSDTPLVRAEQTNTTAKIISSVTL